RLFESGDADRSAVVISDGVWQSQFGGDPSIVGRTVRLNGNPYTIIGVMPSSFYFPDRAVQLLTALTFTSDAFEDRTDTHTQGIGRLKPQVTFEQARADLQVIADRLAREYPQTNA